MHTKSDEQHPPACPGCGASTTEKLGRIPSADTFAGRYLPTPIDGGFLYNCRTCHLQFRWPRLDKASMDNLYIDGDENHWQHLPQSRPDWSCAGDYIQRLPGPQQILDIACFDGKFLASLPSHHQKFGIEINPRAAKVATAHGTTIIAEDYDQLAVQDQKFSVITAFDILEHTHSPHEFMRFCGDALSPGGHLIVSTGNTAAWTWRLMGARYWYCAIAEHVVFICPDWCRWITNALGLEVTMLECISHERCSVSRRTRDTLLNLCYLTSPVFASRCRHFLRTLQNSAYSQRMHYRATPWASARDHLFAVFRKPVS